MRDINYLIALLGVTGEKASEVDWTNEQFVPRVPRVDYKRHAVHGLVDLSAYFRMPTRPHKVAEWYIAQPSLRELRSSTIPLDLDATEFLALVYKDEVQAVIGYKEEGDDWARAMRIEQIQARKMVGENSGPLGSLRWAEALLDAAETYARRERFDVIAVADFSKFNGRQYDRNVFERIRKLHEVIPEEIGYEHDPSLNAFVKRV